MNPKSLLVFLVVLMAGVLGGAAAYQFAIPASSADPTARESLVVDRAERAGKNKQAKAQFAPCRNPAKLEGKKCVTDVVRTVVLPGSSAPARRAPSRGSSSGPSKPAPVPVDNSHGEDEGRHHGGEGEEGHHGDDDDDADDDNGGHHGGDDDTDTDTHSTVSTDTSTSTSTRTHD